MTDVLIGQVATTAAPVSWAVDGALPSDSASTLADALWLFSWIARLPLWLPNLAGE